MGDGSLLLGGHQVTEAIVSFEIHLYPHLIAHLFKSFTDSLGKGYNQEDVVVFVVVGLFSVPPAMGQLVLNLRLILDCSLFKAPKGNNT